MFNDSAVAETDVFLIEPDDFPDGLFVVKKGKLIVVNKAASLLFGYPADTMMSKDFSDYAALNDKNFPRNMRISGMAEGASPECFEYDIKTANGIRKRVMLKFLYKHDGTVVISARDITNHSKIESSLEEISLKYRELVEMLPQGVYETDLDFNLTYVNEFGFSMFGYNRDDFERGMNIRDLIPFEEWNKAFGGITTILSGGVSRGKEYIARRKDGSLFAIESFSSPLMRSGRISGIRGIIIDRSERKKNEKALEYLHLAMGYIVNTENYAVLIVNSEDGRILSGNEHAMVIFRQNPGEEQIHVKEYLKKVKFCDLDRNEYSIKENPVIRALAGEKIDDETVYIRHPDGAYLWLECNAVTLTDSNGKHCITILRFMNIESM